MLEILNSFHSDMRMNLYKFHPNPELIEHYEFHHENVVNLFWDKYQDNPVELKKREEAIAKDAYYAYRYAKYILLNRFSLGEEAMAKDRYYAYYYAKDILHDRFPLGEEAIARVPMYAKCYAKEVIKGPWAINGKTYE